MQAITDLKTTKCIINVYDMFTFWTSCISLFFSFFKHYFRLTLTANKVVQYSQQLQLSLTNRPTLVQADVPYAVNLSGKWLQFIGRIFRLLPTLLPCDAVKSPEAIGKARTAGLQSGKGGMMIDSVVWVQYISVTDTHRQTATSPQQMLRQRTAAKE